MKAIYAIAIMAILLSTTALAIEELKPIPICKVKPCPKPTPQPPFIWMYCRPDGTCVDKAISYFDYAKMNQIMIWQNTYLLPKFPSYAGEYYTFRKYIP